VKNTNRGQYKLSEIKTKQKQETAVTLVLW